MDRLRLTPFLSPNLAEPHARLCRAEWRRGHSFQFALQSVPNDLRRSKQPESRFPRRPLLTRSAPPLQFFVNLEQIPPVLRWLRWLAPLGYALEALSVNEVSSGLPIKDTLAGVPVDVSASLIMETLFGFNPNNYYRDVLVLFAFIVGWATLLVVAVHFRLQESR